MTRIVSLLPAATEMACGIGLRAQLVGVSHECNWPPGLEGLPRLTRSRIDATADSAAIDAQVKQLAATGEALYEIDVDLLAALCPDVIITQAQCDVCAVSLASVENAIATRNELAATRLLALNPQSLAEVIADVERIGAAAGAERAAIDYAESLRARIEAVREAAQASQQSSGRRPRVAVIEWVAPLMAAGNWTPELVEIAGGDYGLATAGRHSPYVEWRQIVDFAPDVLVIAPCGFDLDRSRREALALEKLPSWFELPAVAEKNATVIDGDAYLNRPGPRLVESLEMLHRLIGHWHVHGGKNAADGLQCLSKR